MEEALLMSRGNENGKSRMEEPITITLSKRGGKCGEDSEDQIRLALGSYQPA